MRNHLPVCARLFLTLTFAAAIIGAWSGCKQRRKSQLSGASVSALSSAYALKCNQPEIASVASDKSQEAFALVDETSEGIALARKVKGIFSDERYGCKGCHSPESYDKGPENISDLQYLIDSRRIVPGDVEASRGFLQNLKRMPEGSARKVNGEEIAIVEAWVAAGAPVEKDVSQRDSTNPQFISDIDVMECVANDLRNLERSLDAHQLVNVRYFTLTHLFNARNETIFKRVETGLNLLINSLSWRPVLSRLVPIDPAGTIYRLSLDQLDWNKDKWDMIEAKSQKYSFDSIYGLTGNQSVREEIEKTTKTKQPIIRADWFIAEASFPELYYQLLGLPSTEQELEKLLALNTKAKVLATRDVIRAGTTTSGVSQNNRIIERHDLGSQRYYWKSYDFAAKGGKKDIKQFPLNFRSDGRNFQHDGGEVIFSLPNGLQAYYLATASGARLEFGPTQVVFNRDDFENQGTVFNGYSCMGCHSDGIIPMTDMINSEYSLGARQGSGDEVEFSKDVIRLYKSQPALDKTQIDDSQYFVKKVLEATGTPAEPKLKNSIYLSRLGFKRSLSKAQAAAELGLTVAEYNSRMQYTELGKALGLENERASVSREIFETKFQALRCFLAGIGEECKGSQGKKEEKEEKKKEQKKKEEQVKVMSKEAPKIFSQDSSLNCSKPQSVLSESGADVKEVIKDGKLVFVSAKHLIRVILKCEGVAVPELEVSYLYKPLETKNARREHGILGVELPPLPSPIVDPTLVAFVIKGCEKAESIQLWQQSCSRP